MNEKRAFIFEFVSGGGFNQLDIPLHLFSEGYGMLRAIIADFKLMNIEILTLLDYRINFLSRYLKADNIVIINKDEDYIKKFKDCLNECGMCYIIAPEFSNILYDLTNIAVKKKKIILSVGLNGISLGTSKIKTFNFFIKKAIPTPQTFLIPFKKDHLDSDFIIRKFNQLNCPIIIKPLDGVGAESIFYFEEIEQIKKFFREYTDHLDFKRQYILQEYVNGNDLSVSLIGRLKKVDSDFLEPIILSINSQELDIKNFNQESEYLGGNTPVKEFLEIKKDLKEYITSCNFQINSYYGLDFIRTFDGKLKFIEINPRLTTSYIGIRNIIDINPVEMIYESKINGYYPNEVNIIGHSKFTRLELKYKGEYSINDIHETLIRNLIKDIPELITPPIAFSDMSIKDNNIFSCFISTKSKTAGASQERFKEILKILRKYNFY